MNDETPEKTIHKNDALFVCHRIPYPPNKGDKIRSWQILNWLSTKFNVHLAAFVDDPDDFQHEYVLSQVAASVKLVPLDPLTSKIKSASGFLRGEPLSISFYRDRRMADAVAEIRQHPIQLEMAFSSTMAQYIKTPSSQKSVRIIDFCDADSEKWSAYAQQKRWPLSFVYRREGALLQEAELEIANWADHSFAISPQEAIVLGRGVVDFDWFANGVDTEYFSMDATIDQRAAAGATPSDVIFTGAMDYWANIDAVLWFVEGVWPIVKAQAPGATFSIVGAKPDPRILALDGHNGVSVVGSVPDMRPWLANAKIAVAPMRIARGVQNKVLEAMAMSRPVVLTPNAAAGIDAQDGEAVLVRSDIIGFADTIVGLLLDDGYRQNLGSRARKCVANKYQWSVCFKRLEAAVSDTIARHLSEISTAHPSDR
ncbi:MAG: TIGR03087 family PEP-CTERM/XrtA system glycosyltransferase [Pseudomonadota bacterium]